MDVEEVKVMVSSVTPDAVRRNSTGKINTKSSPSLVSSEEKPPLPQYLRASTNSCHEFCKYGRQHVFEPKKRLPRRIRQVNEVPKQKQVEVPTPKQRGKRPVHKMNLDKSEGPELKDTKDIQDLDTVTLVEAESFEASESINLQNPSDFQGVIASLEHTVSSEGEEFSEDPITVSIKTVEESPEVSGTTNLGSSSPIEKRITSVELATPLDCSEGSGGNSPVNEVEESSLTPALPMKTINKSLKSNPAAPSSLNMTVKDKSLPPLRKSTTTSRARPSDKEEGNSTMKLKIPSPIRRSVAASEEQNRVNSLKLTAMKRVVTEVKASAQLKKELSDRAKVVKEKRTEIISKKKIPCTVEKKTIVSNKPKNSEQKSPSPVKKVITSTSPKVTKQKTSAPVVSLKSTTPVMKSTPTRLPSERLNALRNIGNKLSRSINLSKRDLIVLKPSVSSKHTVDNEISSMKLRKCRSLKHPSSTKKSAAKVGKLENTDEKVNTLQVLEIKTVKPNPKSTKKTYSSSQTAKSDEKLPSPYKLKFQRGKVVNPESANSASEKLKFRQGKGLIEKSSKVGRWIVRKRRVSIGSTADLFSSSVKAPGVVLRHQDVQEKKETQGLFNDVIEETASKLVETRKSKVKALVGAFETVISLQEHRVTPII